MSIAAKLSIVCFLGIILAGITPGEHALIRRYRFEVRNSSHTRLCTTKTMLTINGEFPGPTIYARRGDLVIVDVINRAQHNITIHWHGVKMPRYPWSDGPAYVTQCPITPGNRFVQRIVLSDEEGTLWWHAHSEWYRSSVYGALVILPPRKITQPFPLPRPHAQVTILLGNGTGNGIEDLMPRHLHLNGEWWNRDVQEMMVEFLRSGTDPPASDAFLINGLPGDMYPCSKQDVYRLIVELGKTYLIRLVNAVMDNIMFFRIANHSITVVGTDGAYTKPLRSDYLAISPGQTIDFLLVANQPPSRYYMASRVKAVGGEFVKIPTTGYVEYAGNYTPPAALQLPSFPPFNSTTAQFNFNTQLRSLANREHPIDVPTNAAVNLFYTLSMNLRPCPNASCSGPSGGRILASVNNVTLVLPRNISFLEAYYYRISGVYGTDFPDNPPFPYNYTQDVVPIDMSLNPEDGTEVKILEYDSTVEVVFQGTSQARGVDHPMHLHGYSFYVVGSGLGNFNRSKDPAAYNLVDPPLMENIAVPRNGWTAIRFKANNPGVWFMHCHFERHLSWGMGMVFIVKDGKLPHEKMLPPPPDMPPCLRQSVDSSQIRFTQHNCTTKKNIN